MKGAPTSKLLKVWPGRALETKGVSPASAHRIKTNSQSKRFKKVPISVQFWFAQRQFSFTRSSSLPPRGIFPGKKSPGKSFRGAQVFSNMTLTKNSKGLLPRMAKPLITEIGTIGPGSKIPRRLLVNCSTATTCGSGAPDLPFARGPGIASSAVNPYCSKGTPSSSQAFCQNLSGVHRCGQQPAVGGAR